MFTYICHDILELSKDSPTVLALGEAEILNIRLLMTFEEYEIDQLTYTPIGTNTTKPLVMGCRAHIKLFAKWYNHLRDKGESENSRMNNGEKSTNKSTKTSLRLCAWDRSQLNNLPPRCHFRSSKVVDPVADFKMLSSEMHPFIQSSRIRSTEKTGTVP